jgi:hypothetical protein
MNKPMLKEELWDAVQKANVEHNVVNVSVVVEEEPAVLPTEASDAEHNVVEVNVVVEEEPRKRNLLDRGCKNFRVTCS